MTHSTANQTTLSKLLASHADSYNIQENSGSCNNDISEKQVKTNRGFIETVNLWDTKTVEAIEKGELVLQVGQWVSCGGGHKSRFLGYKNGVFDCLHYPRTGKTFFVHAKLNKLTNKKLKPKEFLRQREKLLARFK